VKLALDHGVVVAVAIDAAVEVEVDNVDAEHALMAARSPSRRGEWLAGRRALRAALREAGLAVPSGAIDADDRGAPRLPAGAVGSISHKPDYAIAIAAAATGQALGIDLERRGPRRIDVSRRVLTPAELAALVARAPSTGDRDDAVVRAFAIKEAIYKAIDPFLRRYVGFQEVAVWPAADGTARVEPLVDWGLVVEATWLATDEHWIATASARRR